MTVRYRSLLVLLGIAISGSFSSFGQSESLGLNPAESLPNAMVPVNATVNDYVARPKASVNDSVCQGGLGDGSQGQIQVCCSPSVTEAEVSKQDLPEVDSCASTFKKESASCALNTREGVTTGVLWSCGQTRVENFSIGSEETVVETRTKAPRKKLSKAERKALERAGDQIERLSPRDVFTALPIEDRKPIYLAVDPESLKPRRYYELAVEAELLGRLPRAAYVKIQDEVVGSKYPACNFFLTTALCQAGYCHKEKPFFVAAHYDSYFYRTGWDLIKLPELKQMFRDRARFDAVIQLDPRRRGQPGHVAIPIGLGEDDRIIIAEGNLGRVTNTVKSVGDGFITSWKGGFKIFVKRDKPTATETAKKSK